MFTTASISIGGSSDDPFYRYQMPDLESRQMKGKTEILNLPSIAKELERPLEFLVAWFKKRLSAAVSVKSGKVVISRLLTTAELRAELLRLVDKVVLCPNCRNPETALSSRGELDCCSCGNVSQLDLEPALLRALD